MNLDHDPSRQGGDGKTLWFCDHTEKYVLGSCIDAHDQTIFDELHSTLVVDDFVPDRHQAIFRAMESIRDSGGVISPDSLELEIERKNQKKKFGQGPFAVLEYINDCVRSAGGGLNFSEMVAKVADLSQKRRMRVVLRDGLDQLDDPGVPAAEIASHLEASILLVNQRSDPKGPVWASDITDLTIEAVFRQQNAGEPPGFQTSIRDLDLKIGGINPGEFVLIAGRPSMGKTTLGMNIADSVVAAQSSPVLFFSLEMSRQKLMERRISAVSKVPLTKILGNSDMTDGERIRILEAGQILKSRPLLIDDTRGRTVGQIISIARKHHARDGIRAVFVDYLQLVTDDQARKSEGRHQEVAGISRRLFDLAGNLGIPVIALAQLNRLSSQRQDKRPITSDLRESGALEQDADLIIMVHWPWFYDREEVEPPHKTQSLLIVGKNRNGETADVPVGFNPECSYFHDLPSESEEALKQGKTFSRSDSNVAAF